MKKNILWAVLLLFLINLFIINVSDAQGFEAVFQGVSGQDIQTGNFTLLFLLLSLSISLVFIFTIMSKIDHFFIIAPYILVRSSRRKLLKKISLELFQIIFFLSCISFLFDLTFSYPVNTQEMIWLLFIFIFYILTFIFWANIIIVLLIIHVKKPVIYFTVMVTLLLLQAFSSNKYGSLLITASTVMIDNSLFILVCKLFFIAISYIAMLRLITNYEFMGDA